MQSVERHIVDCTRGKVGFAVSWENPHHGYEQLVVYPRVERVVAGAIRRAVLQAMGDSTTMSVAEEQLIGEAEWIN